MAGIVYKLSNGTYGLTASEYTQPNAGIARLCVKYSNSTIKYGLTTKTSATQYCKMAIRHSGQNYYIGRRESSASTVNTSSSNSISISTSTSSSTSSSKEYNTQSSTIVNTTLTQSYEQTSAKNSTGQSQVNYNTTYWDVKQTTAYSRTVSVTYTLWSHTLSTFSASGTQWAFQSSSSASKKATSTSTKTSACGSTQYSVSSTYKPNAWVPISSATATYQSETGSRYHSTNVHGENRYTTSKPYVVAGTVTFYTAMDTYTNYSVSTKSTNYSGVYSQLSYLGTEGWRITRKANVYTMKDSSWEEAKVFYQSRLAANGSYATAGGWFVSGTTYLNECYASRPRHTYKASTTALTNYGSREATASSYKTTTSYWTITETKYNYPVTTTGSTSTWKTSSSVSNSFSTSTSTSTSNQVNYSYTTSVASHNYV